MREEEEEGLEQIPEGPEGGGDTDNRVTF